jgi:hypothetical protein
MTDHARVITIQKNTRGRDFIVAQLDERVKLQPLLNAVQFSQNDRLFVPGSLLPATKDLAAHCDLLNSPQVFCTLGAHEIQALAWLTKSTAWGEPSRNFVLAGGNWLHQHSKENQDRLLRILTALPVAMEVEHRTAPFRVVHACWTDALDNYEGSATAPLMSAIKNTRIVSEALQTFNGKLVHDLWGRPLLRTSTPLDPQTPERLTYTAHARTIVPPMLHLGYLNLLCQAPPGMPVTPVALASHDFWLAQALSKE